MDARATRRSSLAQDCATFVCPGAAKSDSAAYESINATAPPPLPQPRSEVARDDRQAPSMPSRLATITSGIFRTFRIDGFFIQ